MGWTFAMHIAGSPDTGGGDVDGAGNAAYPKGCYYSPSEHKAFFNPHPTGEPAGLQGYNALCAFGNEQVALCMGYTHVGDEAWPYIGCGAGLVANSANAMELTICGQGHTCGAGILDNSFNAYERAQDEAKCCKKLHVPSCTDTDSRQTDHYCSDTGLIYNAGADATPNPSDAACCVPATCAATDKYGRAGHPFDCPDGTSFIAGNSAATSPDPAKCCTVRQPCLLLPPARAFPSSPSAPPLHREQRVHRARE